MYYLNSKKAYIYNIEFLRTKFICIIWTLVSLFILYSCSWGLSLFVLFEHVVDENNYKQGSWGLSLFVLFEPKKKKKMKKEVLED